LKQYADGSVPSPSAVGHSPAPNYSASDTYPATPTNVDGQSKWKPAGKMVKEEGGVRFMDSYLWANIHDEVSLIRLLLLDRKLM
jgi:hypothetical protein